MLIANAAKSIFRNWLPALAFRLSLRNSYWDEVEMDILDLVVSRDRAAIDVGANSGRYAFLLSQLASHVYAIEPNPHMVRLLSAGLDRRRVTVLHRAASNSTGTAMLSIPTDIWGNGGESLASLDRRFLGPKRDISVTKMKLDELIDVDIGFMKLDVEGHELAALQGATKVLDRWRPTVLMECDELREGFIPPSIAFLLSRGYDGYFVFSGRFYTLADLKPFMFDNRISRSLNRES